MTPIKELKPHLGNTIQVRVMNILTWVGIEYVEELEGKDDHELRWLGTAVWNKKGIRTALGPKSLQSLKKAIAIVLNEKEENVSPNGSVRISFPFIKDRDYKADVLVTGVEMNSVPGNPNRLTVKLEFSGPTEELYLFAENYARNQIEFEKQLKREYEAKNKFMRQMAMATAPTKAEAHRAPKAEPMKVPDFGIDLDRIEEERRATREQSRKEIALLRSHGGRSDVLPPDFQDQLEGNTQGGAPTPGQAGGDPRGGEPQVRGDSEEVGGGTVTRLPTREVRPALREDLEEDGEGEQVGAHREGEGGDE